MKKILVVGPSLNSIGGISTYLNGFMNSELSLFFNLDYFDTFIRKGRNKPKKSVFKIKEAVLSFRVFIDFFYTCISGKYNAVYLNSSSYWGFWEKAILILISRGLNKEVYLTIHGAEFMEFYRNSRLKLLIPILMGLCKKISFVSKSMEVEFRNIINSETIYIPNPILTPTYNKEKVSGSIIKLVNEIRSKYVHLGLSLSLLEDRKRVVDIIDAYGANSEIALIVAGDGPEFDLVKSKVKQYSNVFFIGSVISDDKSFLLNNCDAFIQNSLEESFGITIIEALLCKKILLSSNVGVIKDITDKFDNLFVLNESIVLCQHELKTVNRLLIKGQFDTECAYNFASNYSWEKQLGNFVSFFGE